MTANRLQTSVSALVLALLAATAQAEESRVRELERTLQQRDQVIMELLERVEALERRVGVRPAEATQAPNAAADTPSDPDRASVNAPGRVVVDEDAAERALERSLTQAGALLLGPGLLEFEPRFTYARSEDTAPSFVMNGTEVFAGEVERNIDSLSADLSLRLGLPWDSQLEIGLPYRSRDVNAVTNLGFTPTEASSESASSFGDLRIGLAKTLFRERIWRPDLVARLTWDTHTGETRDNDISLGAGFHELRGSLTTIKRQDPIAFVGGLSYEHSFERREIQPGPTVAASFGGVLALSPETSLRLFLSGAYQQKTELSGREIDGSDQSIASLVIGGSTLLAPGVLADLSAGIGLTDDADDFSITLSFPFRIGRGLF
jgi:hypothetical protein